MAIEEDGPMGQENAEPTDRSAQITKPVQNIPRICLIDVDKRSAERLKSEGFNCYSGTLGRRVVVPNNQRSDSHPCLLDFDFPPNFHEYNIVIVDLQNPSKCEYSPDSHVHKERSGKDQFVLISEFPETLFDPRPMTSSLLQQRLRPVMAKESILIIFSAANEKIEYQLARITPYGLDEERRETHSLYDFCSNLPSYENLVGTDTKIAVEEALELTSLLNRHNDQAAYSIYFEHPYTWDGKERVKKHGFFPLMTMSSAADKVVSFLLMEDESYSFIFPRIEKKAEFLVELLQKALPELRPALFPYNTRLLWLKDPLYRLPNEQKLLNEKARLVKDHEDSLKDVDKRVSENRQKYDFLHDLLSKSGADLVKTVANYMAWLGFMQVINADETSPDIQEEDIRIECDRGLLVVEVKGIGGTSADNDCSQISKIRYRRMRDRGTLDVFALYIVNHQRFLPPEERQNPPFSATQIIDAESDDRGLLTTYDLFKLYFGIEASVVSRLQAREALLQVGLVQFRPSDAVKLPKPYEIHHNGTVIVVSLSETRIRKGMGIIIADSGRYRLAEILEIQVEGVEADEAESQEVGIRFSEKVSKTSEVWLRSVSC